MEKDLELIKKTVGFKLYHIVHILKVMIGKEQEKREESLLIKYYYEHYNKF